MIVIVPCFAPFLVGENVTLIVHFAAGATLVPQVEVTPNWALAFIDAILSAVVPGGWRELLLDGERRAGRADGLVLEIQRRDG